MTLNDLILEETEQSEMTKATNKLTDKITPLYTEVWKDSKVMPYAEEPAGKGMELSTH